MSGGLVALLRAVNDLGDLKQGRLDAVLALHQKSEFWNWCASCVDNDHEGGVFHVPWPCPTYLAASGDSA